MSGSTFGSTRVALITGGGRGIGLGIARCLADEGTHLAIAGVRDEARVRDALNELRARGADTLYCQADVSDPAARTRMLDQIRAHYGCLHILVNNAGVAPAVRADILEATQESYERVMRINLQGPYFLTQAVARWMIAQGQADETYQACIVNISSISATVASPSRGEYCLSKAGVAMASQLWAVRLAEYGIPVYEVRPGVIRTDMTAGVQQKYDALIADGLTLQPRWGTPEDVGRAVAMLARGDLCYSTGQVVMVDGGMLIDRL
jgi:NAD(P)-dependent dehydrogenase (short-subunit alcohol dehydrogenase family)